MSLQEMVNSVHWEEVEEKIEQKMQELALSFPEGGSPEQIAVHALANKKAYDMLAAWMKDMSFHKGLEREQIRRDYR